MKRILLIIFILSLLIISGCGKPGNSGYYFEQPASSKYICNYNAYNCDDFNTQSKAQAVMEYCGNNDIHHLDGDDDGIACEWNP